MTTNRSDALRLVLADDGDAVAAHFVERHRDIGARLLRPADLSLPGWSYRVGEAAASVAVVEGQRCPAARIRGVVTRLPAITAGQLPHVAEEDRDYVAAEMNAFLLAWLSALPCPVMNRPVAPSLAGPPWRWEQWAAVALRLGIAVAPFRRELSRRGVESALAAEPDAEAATRPSGPRITVVGTRVIGPGPARLARQAQRLADVAGPSLLGLSFDGDDDDARLCAVDPWPDLADPAIAAAVLDAMP